MEKDIQEYPKALYRDGEYTEVRDEAEEAAQREEGFTDWHTDHAKLTGAAESGEAGGEPAEPTRDEMKARAAELGLTYPGNISNAKLAELIANASQA